MDTTSEESVERLTKTSRPVSMKIAEDGESAIKSGDRGAIIAAKNKVDDRIRHIKFSTGNARRLHATKGLPSSVVWLRRCDEDEEVLASLSQRMQKALSDIKVSIKERNILENGTFERLFIDIARERLPNDVYRSIVVAAQVAMTERGLRINGAR